MLLSLQPPAPTLILHLGQVILLLGNLPGDFVLHLLNLIVHHHLIIIQHLPNNLYQQYCHHWHQSVPGVKKSLKSVFSETPCTKGAKNLFFLPIVIRTTTHSLGVPRNIISIGIDPPFLQNIPRMTQMYCFYHPHIYHHCHPHHLAAPTRHVICFRGFIQFSFLLISESVCMS